MMKKPLQYLLLALMSLSGSVFASSPSQTEKGQNNTGAITVVAINQLTDELLNEIMAGNRPDIAVEFTEQTVLPISFFLTGDLVHLTTKEDNTGMLEVKQTFYARLEANGPLLSSDLNEWKPFLEFITGNASMTFHAQSGFTLGAEIDKRN